MGKQYTKLQIIHCPHCKRTIVDEAEKLYTKYANSPGNIVTTKCYYCKKKYFATIDFDGSWVALKGGY